MGKSKFREVQRFQGWDVYILLGFLTLGMLYRGLAGLMDWWGAPAYTPPSTYLLFAVLLGGALLYYASLRLVTKIDEKGVTFRLHPWHFRKRRIRWEDISECHVINMPLRAVLTGWTVDFSDEHRYSVNGRRSGLLIELKNGEHFFIGTQHPEELKQAVCGRNQELV